MNSMSNVRVNEAPHVLEGSGLAPVDGMRSRTRGNEDERLNTNS